MNMKNKLSTKTDFVIITAIAIQYVLLFTQYSFDYLLPVVQMGTRSWPLYFFILDFITIILTILSLVYIVKTKTKLKWIIIALLIFPLFMITTTYSDLTVRYCTTPSCEAYHEPLDLKSIQLIDNTK